MPLLFGSSVHTSIKQTRNIVNRVLKSLPLSLKRAFAIGFDEDCILRMASGAIEEKVDYEVSRVVDNIIDLNTDPKAKRKITITLTFQPDAERKHIAIQAEAKSTLAPTAAVATSMMITADGNGEMVVAEMVPQIPGQLSMSGTEQEPPKILRLVNTN